MRFIQTELAGAFIIDLEKRTDERGFFARSWCAREFAEHGLATEMVQGNVGRSVRRGTLRGLHLQRSPFEEVKLVRCTGGAVYDVAADLRETSPTHLRWVGVELTADDHRMLYIPEGCAHGYLTLTDDAELTYLTSRFYEPDAVDGVRYDDPALGIEWPIPVEVVSEQDRTWPLIGDVPARR